MRVFAGDRILLMNITIVAQRFPYPLDKGDRLTIFNLVKFLSLRHRICLITFSDSNHDLSYEEELRPYCERIETLPERKWRCYFNCAIGLFDQLPLQVHYSHDPAMVRLVDKVIKDTKPDLLYAHYIRMGPYTIDHRHCPRVLAMQLSMTLNYKRLAEYSPTWLHKLLYSVEYRKLQKFEAEFARKFDKVMLISKFDLKAIAAKPPLDNVFFNPHGVDGDYFAADPTVKKEPNSIIFTGNMKYMPNVDGALYFCKNILPLVREKIPDVKLFIVGTDPVDEVIALGSDPAITVTGRVPDLRTYLNQAEVAIAPMRIVAGLLNKLLESMAMSLPTVVTSQANEGIGALDKTHVLVADDAEKFAQHVIGLLGDSTRREAMGRASREFILTEWSWERYLGELEKMFVELAMFSNSKSLAEKSQIFD